MTNKDEKTLPVHNAAWRQKRIVAILELLHHGGSFEEAKKMFDDSFDGVDVAEITTAERQLIASGLNPMEIQNLCNVHAAVFRGKITNDSKTPEEQIPGHPVQVMKLENTVLASLINDELLPVLKKWIQDGADNDYLRRLRRAMADLATIDHHYARKENLIFPIIDKLGITAPPKVMWGVDDEIRDWIKQANQLLASDPLPDKYVIEKAVQKAAKEADEMIFKENAILLPMVLEVFTPADWGTVAAESDPIGYTLIAEPLPWHPSAADLAQPAKKTSALAQALNAQAEQLAAAQEATRQTSSARSGNPTNVPQAMAAAANQPDTADIMAQIHGKAAMPDFVKKMLANKEDPVPARRKRRGAAAEPFISHMTADANGSVQVVLPTGRFTLAELTNILRLLPFEMTFVDAQDTVRWFSDNPDRVFPRTTAVIGRLVVNCHPPKSVDKVEKILADFHSGTRDHADFWIHFRGHYMYIRYFAIRSPEGTYLGCLEVSQDIDPIQAITGEKRLDSDD